MPREEGMRARGTGEKTRTERRIDTRSKDSALPLNQAPLLIYTLCGQDMDTLMDGVTQECPCQLTDN
jgi:hypothetical protein